VPIRDTFDTARRSCRLSPQSVTSLMTTAGTLLTIPAESYLHTRRCRLAFRQWLTRSEMIMKCAEMLSAEPDVYHYTFSS
jgi:hypothetical protein